MMLVVGIMAIVLTIGLPAMVRVLDREPLRQAVSDVVEALSHARAQAILQGRRSEMMLNGDGSILVRIVPMPARPSPSVDAMQWVPQTETSMESVSAPIFEATLGEDIMITDVRVNGSPNLVLLSEVKVARVRFYPNGTSDDFKLDCQDLTGARRITLDPVTGLADVVTVQ
jgi:Tfp pilus assembly protein FimT